MTAPGLGIHRGIGGTDLIVRLGRRGAAPQVAIVRLTAGGPVYVGLSLWSGRSFAFSFHGRKGAV